MNHLHNLPCHEHFLFLGESGIRDLVGANEFTKVLIARVTTRASPATTQDIGIAGLERLQERYFETRQATGSIG
jgi:hypothetical protein